MSHSPQGESIWGNINTCMEIAFDIYVIITEDEHGIEHTGVVARKSTAEKNLSPKAVAMAEQDGEWLCYDEDIKNIALYEVLQRRVAACKRLEAAAFKEMEDIKRDGRLSLTDYFGECSPPAESQQGAISNITKVRNGIYFAQDGNSLQLAVHETVADHHMSPLATEFGHRNGDYLFYDIATSAVALNELKNVFEEIGSLVISEDSLYATLNQKFSIYTKLYNEIMQEDYQIPEVDAPTGLFLAIQLENTEQSISNDSTEQTIPENVSIEEDFNEDVDYEVGS